MTRPDGDGQPLTYSGAGVDTAAGERAVELIKEHVRSTYRPEVVGDVGGFGGLFAFPDGRFHDPLLVASTDGVGTKAVVARLARRYRTIGIDCVAMSVDDIASQGAEPLFFLDYISLGKLVPEEVDELVSGVA
ncbi:MAG TPA: AIR synthase related protein, partial [Acidimicrobiia bacterium]|nr:AIR synthase related protein [Acidimicrobiia bacterium]